MFVADAHRGDGKRYIAHADEKLTAFIELESAIRAVSGWLQGLVRSFLTFDASSSRRENPTADQIARVE